MIIQKPQLTWLDRVYIPVILKGMLITMRHFLRSLWSPEKMQTVVYPEMRFNTFDNYRGKHRLTLKDDGSVRCTACMLCATACPARCIHIEAGEHPDATVEKFPVRYEIDILRCVFCGLCVEACPCDAIRMDTGLYDLSDYRRVDLIYKKEYLMKSDAQLKKDTAVYKD